MKGFWEKKELYIGKEREISSVNLSRQPSKDTSNWKSRPWWKGYENKKRIGREKSHGERKIARGERVAVKKKDCAKKGRGWTNPDNLAFAALWLLKKVTFFKKLIIAEMTKLHFFPP